MKPIRLEQLGSDEDPCFGKLYSLTAPECARCGDYEACSVASQTRMLKETAKEEKSKPFKDIQEAELIESQDKEIRKRMIKMAKKSPTKFHSIEKLVPLFREFCNLTDIEDNNLFQRIANQAKKSKRLILKGSKYKYNDKQD